MNQQITTFARRVLALAFVTAAWPQAASAYLGTPYLTPASPTTSTPITVNVDAGYCHGFEDQTERLITLGPQQLRLEVDGVVASGMWCIAPEATYTFQIGLLPAGSYSLELLLLDPGSFVDKRVSVGTLSFVVTEPTAVPASSTAGLVCASTLLLAGGWFLLRVQSRSSSR